MSDIALYIHFPFCKCKCAYCDFPSYPAQEHMIPAYLQRLRGDLARFAARYPNRRVVSIYIGGGTPSLMSGGQMTDLLNDAAKYFAIADDAEISCEGNPGTVNDDKLLAYRQAGLNRLSLGVQAFDDALLRTLGRIHTRQDALDAVDLASHAGFNNLSIDLMYALPAQGMTHWQSTLKTAASLPVSHISCYSLILEDNTPLKARMDADASSLPTDEASVGMTHFAQDFLQNHGFTRYEISNYARPDMECRHNLTYWRRGEYLGVGCAAHSMMENERFSFPATLREYMNSTAELPHEHLTEQDAFEETIMLGLRTREGISANMLPDAKLTRLIEAGLLVCNNGRVRVTQSGADVLNAVILALI